MKGFAVIAPSVTVGRRFRDSAVHASQAEMCMLCGTATSASSRLSNGAADAERHRATGAPDAATAARTY